MQACPFGGDSGLHKIGADTVHVRLRPVSRSVLGLKWARWSPKHFKRNLDRRLACSSAITAIRWRSLQNTHIPIFVLAELSLPCPLRDPNPRSCLAVNHDLLYISEMQPSLPRGGRVGTLDSSSETDGACNEPKNVPSSAGGFPCGAVRWHAGRYPLSYPPERPQAHPGTTDRRRCRGPRAVPVSPRVNAACKL